MRRLAAWMENHALVFVALGGVILIVMAFLVIGDQQTLKRHDREFRAQATQLSRISEDQLANRVENVGTWCAAINQGRDYDRQFQNLTQAQQTAELQVVTRALEGKTSLTPEQLAFLRMYIGSVVALERAVPQLHQLHRYSLGDLPCGELEQQTRESGAKHRQPQLKFSEPVSPACQPRNPPAAGECVAEHYGFKPGPKPTVMLRGPECTDISRWQGAYPVMTGLRCVIIQASYGLSTSPTLYSQIADANVHHVPWGAYTFMEGYSGAQEAAHAVQVTNGRGRTLGVWADAEIGAAYPQACSYVNEARALGVRIYGVYSAPGIYRGGHCAGFLWPAEWGGGAAYPFAGYSWTAIKVRQWCGTCFRFGVETDLDEDLGLVGLSHPGRSHQQQLTAERRLRDVLLADLHRHGCFHIHGKQAYKLCPRWGTEWRAVEHQIRNLT